MKAGTLDKYLLNTKPEKIDSKFGLYLREQIKKKPKDPDYDVGYIPGTAKISRNRRTTVWEYKKVPAIYIPASVRVSEDFTKYYVKAPQDMSRHEIAELEQ